MRDNPNDKAKPFDIRVTKQVVFRDCEQTVLKVYEPGDIVKATAKNEHAEYFITGMGGIYFNEAEEVVA